MQRNEILSVSRLAARVIIFLVCSSLRQFGSECHEETQQVYEEPMCSFSICYY